MSFKGWKTHIEEGDLVIAYLSRESMMPIVINKKETYNNKYGIFRHNDMIGKEYGSKMGSHTGRGFMYLLHPTPELWTQVLPHRTQILYAADISFITSYLDLKPGSKVIESGTGSGSFSHSLARTIAPTGKLFSFEYHEERATLARGEFEAHGFGDIIKLEHRDVCADGFGIKDTVHAGMSRHETVLLRFWKCTVVVNWYALLNLIVFLDLPAPWDAIPATKETFKQRRTGKICCFSPCIEQVTKTVASLNENGFVDITMYECLIRNHDVRTIQVLTVADAIQSAKDKAQQKSLMMQQRKRKRQQRDDPKPDEEDKDQDLEPEADGADADADADASTVEQEPDADAIAREVNNMLVTKTPVEARGHTSYLTFGTFLPVLDDDMRIKEVSAEGSG
ncbi:hypothetical protein BC938DRAFT_480728 [Jimgerdemannia flammicorona]|uniref:tRNA (adenine(58)-N(1))-methyltransferase catalytic subunit TRM61 n=1 Tax=Jimgerdemannia flammicorona TaxID=994334 RepID=A0A433QHQ9_9FUNG|nr:hypothetical protein BC938DRAFT_480728 [Jimgerdemannia flammicorona]